MRDAGRPAYDGIYAIVDAGATADPAGLSRAVLAAGVRVVQYRAKSGVDRGIVRSLQAAAAGAGAVLIVNDDVEAALECGGWHGGQEDIAGRDLAELRVRLGSRAMGISCGTPEEARRAEAAGADYLGVGPYRATSTKLDAGAAIGVAGIAAVARATTLPVVAIGGIGLADLEPLVTAGAAMAAVISAIAGAPDPGAAAAALVERWRALHRA